MIRYLFVYCNRGRPSRFLEVAGNCFGVVQDDVSEVSDVAGKYLPVGEAVGPPGGFRDEDGFIGVGFFEFFLFLAALLPEFRAQHSDGGIVGGVVVEG